MIRAVWRIFWLAVVAFAISFGAAWMFVPDVVPVGYSEEAQPSWEVLTAFLLRAIELTSAWVAAIALVAILAVWATRRLRAKSNPT
jgi:type II secretory pathway component PulF